MATWMAFVSKVLWSFLGNGIGSHHVSAGAPLVVGGLMKRRRTNGLLVSGGCPAGDCGMRVACGGGILWI